MVAAGSGVWGARSNLARRVFALSALTLIIIYPALPNPQFVSMPADTASRQVPALLHCAKPTR